MNWDSDIIKFAEIVLEACIAEFSMNEYDGWEFTAGERINFA